MEFVLGIDLGTSYFKLGLFDRNGTLRGLGRVAVANQSDDRTRFEVPADHFWSLLGEGLGQACREAKASAEQIQAVGYSSQANSFILLDANDKPLTPLILWPDRRAEKVDSAVEQLWGRDDFLTTTGLGMACTPEFCVVKLRWLQQNQPEMWSRVARVMTISDYLTYMLTGETVGDMGTASLLGLFDLQNQRWWDEGFNVLGLSRQQFSTPLRPGTVAGKTSNNGTELLGLKAAIPFAVGGLDHHVAAVGAGIGEIADMSESTGTVLACLKYSRRYEPRINCCMGPGLDDTHYYQLAFNDNGAGSLEWYQRRHAPDHTIAELSKMAESIAAGSDGLIAKPQSSQYPGLTGFANATPSHTHGHFVRAIMESTAASLAELVADLCPQNTPARIIATGGGARSDLWLRIKADTLAAEFIPANCTEPACKGAATLAMKTV